MSLSLHRGHLNKNINVDFAFQSPRDYNYGMHKNVMPKWWLAIFILWLSIKLKQKKPLLSLVMIVKNEADSITETLLSVRDHVDYYCILDTGSTDNTVDLIEKAMNGTKGRVYYEPFVDFGTTRNRAIELEGGYSSFAIMLSGDETVKHASHLRKVLSQYQYVQNKVDAFRINIEYDGQEYTSVRIHRTDSNWSYIGKVHEVMSGPSNPHRIQNASIVHALNEKNRQDKRERAKLDLVILLNEWPTNPSHRNAFYIAQSYQTMGNYSQAYEWYEKRWKTKGWSEEEYAARFRMAYMAELLKRPWADVETMYFDASNYIPTRAEPLYRIARHYYHQNNSAATFMYALLSSKIPYPSSLRLFNNKRVYDYHIHKLISWAAYEVQEYEAGKNATEKALMVRPDDKYLQQQLKRYKIRIDQP